MFMKSVTGAISALLLGTGLASAGEITIGTAPNLQTLPIGTLEKIIQEVAATRITERGGRADDKRSETSMEDRKKEGYF